MTHAPKASRSEAAWKGNALRSWPYVGSPRMPRLQEYKCRFTSDTGRVVWTVLVGTDPKSTFNRFSSLYAQELGPGRIEVLGEGNTLLLERGWPIERVTSHP